MLPATTRSSGETRLRERIGDEQAREARRSREESAAVQESTSPAFEFTSSDRYRLADPIYSIDELCGPDAAS